MKDHLTSALAQLNGSADWNKRTGGTLPAKLTCFEAQDVLIALQELQTRAERAETELAAEREKVRVLRLACDQICEEWGINHDANPIGAGQRMSTRAGKALEATEDAT